MNISPNSGNLESERIKSNPMQPCLEQQDIKATSSPVPTPKKGILKHTSKYQSTRLKYSGTSKRSQKLSKNNGNYGSDTSVAPGLKENLTDFINQDELFYVDSTVPINIHNDRNPLREVETNCSRRDQIYNNRTKNRQAVSWQEIGQPYCDTYEAHKVLVRADFAIQRSNKIQREIEYELDFCPEKRVAKSKTNQTTPSRYHNRISTNKSELTVYNSSGMAQRNAFDNQKDSGISTFTNSAESNENAFGGYRETKGKGLLYLWPFH